MKGNIKRLAIVLLICMLTLSVVALVACNKGVYTVKVVDEDGNPYTSGLVQLCKVESNGLTSTCYNPVPTNANGVAVLTIGKEISDKNVDEMEVHVQGLPVYLQFEQGVRMHKNETKTIKVEMGTFGAPYDGTGEGQYAPSLIPGEPSDQFDYDNSHPYIVEEDGAFELIFDSAEQKIYYEFRAYDAGVYKIYTVGNVDTAVNQLTGTPLGGFRNTHDDAFVSRDISATNKNFSLQYEISPELIEQCDNGMYGICLFEVSLEDASHVGMESIICFERVGDYEGQQEEQAEPVYPAKDLTPYRLIGEPYADLELNSSAQYVKDSDGYYHVGSVDGAMVIATLGKGSVVPRGLGLSFMGIYEQGQAMIVDDGTTLKDYLPLVQAYTEASNSQGRYPLTEELMNFFNAYIKYVSRVDYLEGIIGDTIPQGKEWMVLCGIYEGELVEDELGGIGEPDGSSEENAIPLLLDERVTVSVPAGGKVYYSFGMMFATKLIISPLTENSKLTVYKQSEGATSATIVELTEKDDGLLAYQIDIDGGFELYFLVFSTANGEAEDYMIAAEVAGGGTEEAEGTFDNPIVIDEFKEYSAPTNEEENWMGGTDATPVYFIYTATEQITLYFKAGDNTTLNITWIKSEGEDEYYVDGTVGITLSAGDVLKIEVMTENYESGTVTFTVSNSPIAPKQD